MIEMLMAVLVFLGGGGTDLASTVDTDAYWKAKDVTVSIAQLMHDAKPGAAVPDVAGQIKELGSTQFAKREAAKKAILAIGPQAIEPLKEAAKSKDAEIATSAAELIGKLELLGKANEIRQLMAIRTLGERKSKEASGLLKELSASSTPFVADYAARALAQVEGREPTAAAPVDHKKLMEDVALMPSGLGVLAQQTAGLGSGMTVGGFIDMATPLSEGAEGAEEKAKMKERGTKFVVGLLERVGNVRIDSVTFGMGAVMDDDHGFAVVTIHGKWDKKLMAEALRDHFEGAGDAGEPGAAPPGIMQPVPFNGPAGGPQGPVPVAPGGPAMNIMPAGGVVIPPPGGAAPQPAHREPLDTTGTVVLKGPEEAAVIVSDEQMMLIVGNEEDRIRVTDKVALAIKTGKGELGDDKEMVSAMKGVDTTLPLWGVIQVAESFKKAELLAPYQRVIFSGAVKGKTLDLRITGESKDGAAATLGKSQLDELVQDILAEFAALDGTASPSVVAEGKVLSSILKKIQPKVEGARTTVAGSLSSAEVFSIMRQVPVEDLLNLLNELPDTEEGAGAVPGNPGIVPPAAVDPMPR